MNYDQILGKAEDLQEEIVSGCILTNAEELGLHPRCGELWVCPEFIATNRRGELDYYGGFEYIEDQYVIQIWGLTVYSKEASRVSELLQVYTEKERMKSTKVIVHQYVKMEYEIEVVGEVNKESVAKSMEEVGYPDASKMETEKTWYFDQSNCRVPL